MKTLNNSALFVVNFNKKQTFSNSIIILSMAFVLLSAGCKNEPEQEPEIVSSSPFYDKTQIHTTSDSIRFDLSSETFNAIKSFNLFTQNNNEYISFFDELSGSINVYHFQSRALVKRMRLKKWLKNAKLYKTTAYVKNFDSIFITNEQKLYLFDSSGHAYKKIKFLESPHNLYATFENTNPPIFKNHLLYAGIRPYMNTGSLKALKKWKVIYQFNLNDKSSNLYHHLPKMLWQNYFGYYLSSYNYCYNNRSNFVLSFSGDTNVYETNLSDLYTAHFAKSKFQTSAISPLMFGDLGINEEYKHYKLNYSYGPIFFDPYRKRYIRLAYQKMSTGDFEAKGDRKESLVIMDEDLRVIGESEFDKELSFSSLFFTKDGMYARTKVKNEYALYFVRLAYKEVDSFQLTKN